MANIAQAPIRTPLMREDGSMDANWQRWFSQLSIVVQELNVIGNASVPMSVKQSGLADLKNTLTTSDAGKLINVTDFNHVMQWDGSKLTWAPGEAGGGFIRTAVIDPNPQTGWHECDGSVVMILQPDGSLKPYQTIDMNRQPVFLQFGPVVSGVNGANPPTLALDPFTPKGTISAPVLTMNSYTPAGTVSAPTLAMNNFTPSGTIGSTTLSTSTFTPVALATQAVTQASHGHTFSGIAGAISGTASAPTFTGTPATLTGTNTAPTFTGKSIQPTGTIGADGYPQNIMLRAWVRL